MKMYEDFLSRFDFLVKGDYKQWFERIPTEDVYTWFRQVEYAVEHRVQRIAFGAFVAGVLVSFVIVLIIVFVQNGVR
jgi:hypothetical protein